MHLIMLYVKSLPFCWPQQVSDNMAIRVIDMNDNHIYKWLKFNWYTQWYWDGMIIHCSGMNPEPYTNTLNLI